jgi:hypothetical protein
MSNLTDINQLEEGFQELQKYSDSQFHLVNKLREDIARLESENKSLKIMIEQNLPSIGLQVGDVSLGISNEQLICEVQLNMLKDLAVGRSLTLEETKRFEIYTKILKDIKSGNKNAVDINIQKMSDEELIKAAAINV